MSQRRCFLMMFVGAGLVAMCASGASASIIIETVPVGNPGNPGDTRYPAGGVPSFGGVGYTFNIGKYEVTAGQYTSFLNAVAATDTYALYNTDMGNIINYGANIQRTGTSGSYTYSVGNGSPTDVAAWANRPVTWVSWGDAARFANWMHNGQPTGTQNLATTEDGAYFVNGATWFDLAAVPRKANATWVLPTEDEWYKAAYHKNDGVTGNYWDYPMGSSAFPNNGNPGGDTGNSANFYSGGYAIGSPYYRTNVGFYSLSDSPYGTFDQGGNVWEWNETVVPLLSNRGVRGGVFANGSNDLRASVRSSGGPPFEYGGVGFRLSKVPEPTTIALLALASLGTRRGRRRRCSRGPDWPAGR